MQQQLAGIYKVRPGISTVKLSYTELLKYRH
jgi:hypothetical protein